MVALSLQLRGGGKAKTHRDATSLPLTSERTAVVNAGKELKQAEHKINDNRGSRERSAILSELVAGMEVDDLSSTRKLSIQRVEQLRMALAKKDKAAISSALEKIAAAARKEFAPSIWKVKPLATDGMAVGGSGRQRELQRSTTAFATAPVPYTGRGESLAAVRRAAEELALPNPTDAVLGIDKYTELRLALRSANQTREVAVGVRTNRELSRVAKAAVGDMLVSEDVAVKWWLEKKRERQAEKQALQAAARREDLVRKYAAMLYVMSRMKAEERGAVWNAEEAEVKALRRARYVYEMEGVEEQRSLAKAARSAVRSGAVAGPAIVKPKGRKRVSLIGRHGRPHVKKKAKVVKVTGGAKRNKATGRGSQRKKRSGISGGSSGTSRFKKRTT
eukprot:CAMPEP_0172193356 /NCGR_PEP_ID=MMETSP1050-20130122/24909_1 /TAXON_ID=233186 /ORGANISM="Cryptomonas curvata, Strain CCAP979/52" /LENGTH=390 /DNA_ID=CAMNT_0012868903 /DNA_START=242 /DNA_END=1414 /DNA_ORIENTATION=-